MAHFYPDISLFVKEIAHRLSQAYGNDDELCHHYAWWMVEAATGSSKAILLAQKKITLSDSAFLKIEQWISKQNTENEPLQYLIGTVPFCGLDILVAPPTLIPRPETEEWVTQYLSLFKPFTQEKFTILDMCAGSGCIALACAQALPASTVYAVDIAPSALALLKKNIAHNAIKNVEILHSDLFATIPKNLKFDCILSNPPYITEQEWLELAPSVKNWEDKTALVAPDQGLRLIEALIEKAHEYLKPNANLKKAKIPNFGVEIGYKQGQKVAFLLQQAQFENVQIWQDLAHKDRFVVGSR